MSQDKVMLAISQGLVQKIKDIILDDKNKVTLNHYHLYFAVEHNQCEIFKFFYKLGLYYHPRDFEMCIKTAVKNNASEILDYLVNTDIKIDRKHPIKISQRTLMTIVEYGRVELFKYFDDAGFNLDEQCEYILKKAIVANKVDFVKYFIDNIRAQKYLQTSMFDDSLKYERFNIIKLLIGKGIDFTSLYRTTSISALMDDNIKILKFLMQLGFKPAVEEFMYFVVVFNRDNGQMLNFLFAMNLVPFDNIRSLFTYITNAPTKKDMVKLYHVMQHISKRTKYSFLQRKHSIINQAVNLSQFELKNQKNFLKNNPLKSFLKPRSLHMQMILVD
jgi:hypothetical protein